MIELILQMLEICEERTELIDIARGKYKQPESIIDALKYVKKWR